VSRLLLDAGALIAIEREDQRTLTRVKTARERGRLIVTHAGIVGQVWRNPSRQARLSLALKSVEVFPLTDELARRTGLLLAAARTADVHDGALVAMSRPSDRILTSDVGDLAHLVDHRGTRGVVVVAV
jgi:hypothetical protein